MYGEKFKQSKIERTNLNKMRLIPIKESRQVLKEKRKDVEVEYYK